MRKIIEETDDYIIHEEGQILWITNKHTGGTTHDRWKTFGDGWSNKRLILNKLRAIVLNGLI